MCNHVGACLIVGCMGTGHEATGGVHRARVSLQLRTVPGMTPLKQVRLLSGLRQVDVAAAAGVARQTVSLLEAGGRNPHLSTALAISKVLGCDVSGLWPEFGLTFAEQSKRTAGLPAAEKLKAFGALPQSEQDEVSTNIAAAAEADPEREGV
jgi:putative transcriptional regulator